MAISRLLGSAAKAAGPAPKLSSGACDFPGSGGAARPLVNLGKLAGDAPRSACVSVASIRSSRSGSQPELADASGIFCAWSIEITPEPGASTAAGSFIRVVAKPGTNKWLLRDLPGAVLRLKVRPELLTKPQRNTIPVSASHSRRGLAPVSVVVR